MSIWSMVFFFNILPFATCFYFPRSYKKSRKKNSVWKIVGYFSYFMKPSHKIFNQKGSTGTWTRITRIKTSGANQLHYGTKRLSIINHTIIISHYLFINYYNSLLIRSAIAFNYYNLLLQGITTRYQYFLGV